MRRTNIYLDDEQLARLKLLSTMRNVPVASLVREALDAWLATQKVGSLPKDEWERRFKALLKRRDAIWKQHEWDAEDVERDVMEAVREVRAERAARRR
jgi:hypothetical protein